MTIKGSMTVRKLWLTSTPGTTVKEPMTSQPRTSTVRLNKLDSGQLDSKDALVLSPLRRLVKMPTQSRKNRRLTPGS